MSLEPKKKYRFDKACTGLSCPIRFGCHRFFVLNYRGDFAELIRPPFIKRDGKFIECPEYKNI